MSERRVFSPVSTVQRNPQDSTSTFRYPGPSQRAKNTILKYQSVHSIAKASISDKYVPEKDADLFCRSLLWKAILLNININKSSFNDQMRLDLSNLRKLRSNYNDLLMSISPPWHLLNTDSTYFRELDEINQFEQGLDVVDNKLKIHKLHSQHVISGHDPLNNQNFNARKKSIDKDVEILNVIITDVERLFPDYPKMFIDSIADKRNIVEILYRYSKICDRGYIQGMHEICGIIYVILQAEICEKIEEEPANGYIGQDITDDLKKDKGVTKLDLEINELLLDTYFAHDVFSTFSAFITPLLDKYFSSSGVVQQSILFGIKLRHIDPILETALRRVDVVGGHAQVWLSRWFRMLATREVGVKRGIRLWDGLISFAHLSETVTTSTASANLNLSKKTPDVSKLLPFAILLLLLRIRTELLIASGEDPITVTKLSAATNDPLQSNPNSNVSTTILNTSSPNNSASKNENFDDTDVLYLLLHYPENAIGSVSELISDASTLALVENDDKELRMRGSLIVNKCSSMKGVLGGVVAKPIPKPSENVKSKSVSPWSGMLKKASSLSKSWTIPSSENETPEPSYSNKMLDEDRMRLEMKLQQKVKDKLKK